MNSDEFSELIGSNINNNGIPPQIQRLNAYIREQEQIRVGAIATEIALEDCRVLTDGALPEPPLCSPGSIGSTSPPPQRPTLVTESPLIPTPGMNINPPISTNYFSQLQDNIMVQNGVLTLQSEQATKSPQPAISWKKRVPRSRVVNDKSKHKESANSVADQVVTGDIPISDVPIDMVESIVLDSVAINNDLSGGILTPASDNMPYIIGKFIGCDVVMDDDEILRELNNNVLGEFDVNTSIVDVEIVPVAELGTSVLENDEGDDSSRKRKTANSDTSSLIRDGDTHPVVFALAAASNLPPLPPAKSSKNQVLDDEGFTRVTYKKSPGKKSPQKKSLRLAETRDWILKDAQSHINSSAAASPEDVCSAVVLPPKPKTVHKHEQPFKPRPSQGYSQTSNGPASTSSGHADSNDVHTESGEYLENFVRNTDLVPYKIAEIFGCPVVLDEDQIIQQLQNEDCLDEFDPVTTFLGESSVNVSPKKTQLPTPEIDALSGGDARATNGCPLQNMELDAPDSVVQKMGLTKSKDSEAPRKRKSDRHSDSTSAPTDIPVVIALAAPQLPPKIPSSSVGQSVDADGFTKLQIQTVGLNADLMKMEQDSARLLEFMSYNIGNGLLISLWYDPWWNGSCLASHNRDPIIQQSGLTAEATINTLTHTGQWILPRPSSRLHHVQHNFLHWLHTFNFPDFNLQATDVILWNGTPLKKLKIWHIWDSIRLKRPPVFWSTLVWHKLAISRYAHHQWILCWNRLPTLHRLASFGLPIPQHCFLCVGGIETASHLFVTCSYSSFVLSQLAEKLHIPFTSTTWESLMMDWGAVSNTPRRQIALVTLQVFCYHLWRERNARAHGKGCFGPTKLFDGIVLDIRTKLGPVTG
ncbi:hypothetical protein POM88_028403 [Heracleum sosnowskyi]|uniref:Reverse transcriptase zinc-binding domain-containing protein n=1 Tax=Heracleum sosnowskyi TaxID=360622 RepID=A0AAD8ME15_9APIA|nr:hypothetical protein POM88_028403 [Heracleum sosnowskyi]